MKIIICFFALLLGFAHAGTVYKTVDANGRVVYTDSAPTAGKVTTLNYADAPFSPEPESVTRYRQELLKGIDQTMAKAEKYRQPSNELTLFATSWCGYCRQARAYLKAHNLPYREYDIETPDGAKALVESGIKGKGVPLLVKGDKNQRGFKTESYDKFFGA
jgi:glutaredoxin